uniref:TATA box-binding protein-like 1 n=1 Tax=Setaria digitata TaxID=48799 RepID=A0A915Q810_9BILA
MQRVGNNHMDPLVGPVFGSVDGRSRGNLSNVEAFVLHRCSIGVILHLSGSEKRRSRKENFSSVPQITVAIVISGSRILNINGVEGTGNVEFRSSSHKMVLLEKNDHGSYTLNGSSVTTSAAAKVIPGIILVTFDEIFESNDAVWHSSTMKNSFLEGFSSQHLNPTGSNLSETSGSQNFVGPELFQSQTDSFHLNVPVHDEECVELTVNSSSKKIECEEQTEEAPPSTSSEIADHDDSDEDGEIDIQIRNVVCNYILPLHIDLHRVALSSGNVAFDRGRGVLLKQKRNPSCYVKIYSSGKIYIVGCRSESECKRAARGVARMVQKSMGKMMDVVRIRNYRVCNVLATCKMPFGIKIEELAQKYPECSQYEPELSVGLIWRSTNPRATLRIHTTGTASESDVMKAIEVIYPIIKEFRCALRLRNPIITKPLRKRKLGVSSNTNKRPHVLQPSLHGLQRFPGSSGVFGNRVYFSDEDDEEDEFEDVV